MLKILQILVLLVVSMSVGTASVHIESSEVVADEQAVAISISVDSVLVDLSGSCPVDGVPNHNESQHHCQCSHLFVLTSFDSGFFPEPKQAGLHIKSFVPNPYLEMPAEPPIRFVAV